MRKFRRTSLITAGCLALLAGLGLARLAAFAYADWLLIFLPALTLIKKKNLASLVLVVIAGLMLGLWRGSLYMQKVQLLQNLSQQHVTIQAQATSDAVYANNKQLQFTANKVILLPGKAPSVSARRELAARQY